jgi:hypothetical protein
MKALNVLKTILAFAVLFGLLIFVGRTPKVEFSEQSLVEAQASLAAYGAQHHATEKDFLLQMWALEKAEHYTKCNGTAEHFHPTECRGLPLGWTLYHNWKQPAFTIVPGIMREVDGDVPRYEPTMVIYVWDADGKNFELRIDEDGKLYHWSGSGWVDVSDSERVRMIKKEVYTFAHADVIK